MITRIVAVLIAAAAAIGVTVSVSAGRALLGGGSARTVSLTPVPQRAPASSAVSPGVSSGKPPGGPAGASRGTAAEGPAIVVGLVSNDLPSFDRSCGCAPNVSAKFVHIGAAPPSPALPRQILANRATPLMELEPAKTSLNALTAGAEDTWLSQYARMIRSQDADVYMSFAPEPNGHWYTWGWPNVQPAAEVAAWRHVVSVFRRAGATNVKWVWIVNTLWAGSGPLPKLWPGAAYVDEVGIDGYFRKGSDTFDSIFGPTISQLRQITDKKILIAETGASTSSGQARALSQLSGGVARYGLAGFLWFDINQRANGLGPADWAISNSPAALANYKSIVKRYERPAS